jgi:diamine N-acetyltransferase
VDHNCGRSDTVIRELASQEDLERSVSVIRDSFADVAAEFGLTPQNCPTHPSFMTLDDLMQMNEPGLELIGIFDGSEQVGFVAIEKADPDLYYLERLAVMPDHRRRGHGSALVNHVISRVRDLGGKRLSIGIIAESSSLKGWYKNLGFSEVDTREFQRLPFTVCFMDTATTQESSSRDIL